MHQAAILTGDLVGSTEAGAAAVEAALSAIAGVARDISSWATALPRHHPWRETRFTRYRGDGWQFAAPLTHGPRAALLVAARLAAAAGLQSRISLGLGGVVDWGAADQLSGASGPALVASGHGLDSMAADQRMTLAGGSPRDRALMILCATLARGWSPEQAEALAHVLPPERPRQSEIAARLGISPQAVSLRLRGAAAGPLLEALGLWETELERRRLFPPIDPEG